jgi:FSR family fosmidomycin resistance protein-like MFS transporter
MFSYAKQSSGGHFVNTGISSTRAPNPFHAWLATPIGTAVLLFSAHALNDSYNSYLGALMPVVMDHFGLTLSMAGLLAAVSNVSGSIFQPVFGYMLDRTPKRPNVFIWPIITSMATCAIGLMPTVSMVVPLLIIAGLSTAVFHPHASSTVPAAGSRAGLIMALFLAGGTTGFAVGPAISLALVRTAGLQRLWLLAIPTVAASIFLWRFGHRSAQTRVGAGIPMRLELNSQKLRALLAIWGIVTLRSTVGTAFSTFLSVHLRRSGFPLILIGVALLVHTGIGVFGNLIGGHLSDRIGRKTTVTLGLCAILPTYLLLMRSSGAWVWVFLALGGFAMSFFQAVTIVMALALFPENRGMAAGLIMGLGWSVGGLLVSAVGAIADRIGIQATLEWVTLLLIPAILISTTLPGTYMKSDSRAAGKAGTAA